MDCDFCSRVLLIHSIDQRLKDHIRKMVWENNITSVPQMKTLLEVFMKEALFSGHHIRAITNKRFWPSNIDIQNHIALAIKKQQNNNIDQVILTLKLNLGIHDLKTVKNNNNSSSSRQ